MGAVPPPPLPALPAPATGADLTRDRLLGAAHELFHERRSTTASVSEICARAGVNVAMVKYCFGSKDGMLDALVERITQSFSSHLERLSALELGPRETLRRHVAAIVRNYVRYPYVNRLLHERLMAADEEAAARMSAVFARPTCDWEAALLAEGRRRGEFADVDPTFFFFSVMGLCEFFFSAQPWLGHAFGLTMDDQLVERFIEHTVAFVLGAVATGG
jgi:TetR/AcrR family transcriptional regulator